MRRTCTRIHGFDYGHRVVGHEGKCASLHGHRGTVEITCASDELDGIGRVIDFGKIKEVVCKWIDESLDHRMILKLGDVLLNESADVFGPRSPFIMSNNPTAENLAELIYHKANMLLGKYGIICVHVRFWETPNCCAEFGTKQ